MASIRRLKKDIDYLTYAVVADSLNYSIWTDKNEDKVSEIIADIIAVRNNMRDKINSAGKFSSRQESKKYYRNILTETLKSVDDSFTKLSQTVKK